MSTKYNKFDLHANVTVYIFIKIHYHIYFLFIFYAHKGQWELLLSDNLIAVRTCVMLHLTFAFLHTTDAF